MYRKLLKKEVDEKLKEMERLAKSVSISHDEEDIHRLRVNYKKLRALLRMAHPKNSKNLIPESFITLYRAAGIVRDLQLHYKTISAYFLQYDTIPANYLQHIEEEIQRAKLAYKKAYVHLSFSRITKLIHKTASHKLHHNDILRWHTSKLIQIHAIKMGMLTDEAIHEVRKAIKDLAYTKDFITPDKDYDSITHLLGSYLDICVLLSVIDKYSNNINTDEREMMEFAQVHWLAEKVTLRPEVISAITGFD